VEQTEQGLQRLPLSRAQVEFGTTGGCTLAPAGLPTPLYGWATGLQLATAPGQCTVTATVETFREDGGEDETLTAETKPVYALAGMLSPPIPPFVLGKCANEGGPLLLHYQILPDDYPARNTVVEFIEDGRLRGRAEAAGRGDGTLAIGPISFFENALVAHNARVVVNDRYVWHAAGTLVPTRVAFDTQPVNVVKVDIVTDSNRDGAVDERDQPTRFARIGHWGDDNPDPTRPDPITLDGFDPVTWQPLNGPPPDNFVDRDPDRFYVRVIDRERNTSPSSKETVRAKIQTLTGNNATDDGLTEIELKETANNSGIFASMSQLLMRPERGEDVVKPDFRKPIYPWVEDEPQTTDPVNDRGHRASLEGSVEARYETSYPTLEALTDATVFNRAPDERRRLFVRVWVFNEPTSPHIDVNGDKKQNTVLGSEDTAKEIVARAIADTNSLLAQAGIQVELARPLEQMFVEAPERNGRNVLAENPPEIDASDLMAIASAFQRTASPDVVDVFYAGPFPKNEHGQPIALAQTMTPVRFGNQLGDVSRSFMDTTEGLLWDLVLAHELLHVLENGGRDASNPPGYVFYPSNGAYGTTRGTWGAARRITHFTEYLIFQWRQPGNLTATGSHYLKDW
jgi:hypothetical protein